MSIPSRFIRLVIVATAAVSWLATGTALARQGGGIGSPNVGSPGTIELVEGGGSNRFWSYDIGQDWWTVRTLPGAVGEGGDMSSRFNSCAYGLLGNGTPIFYRVGFWCGQATGGVERLADAPFVPGRGAKVSALSGSVGSATDEVYVLRGGNTAELWRYSIAANTWSRMADVPANVGDAGALDLVFGWDGVSQFAWHLAVLTTSGSSTMYLYNIAQATWTGLPMPFALGPGASVIGDMTGGYEVLVGGGPQFWHYQQFGGWQRLADTPGPVTAGADMIYTYYGNNMDDYVYPGDGATDIWAYTHSSNSWSVIARLPVDNQPPIAEAGGPLTLEGCPTCALAVPLNTSLSSDPDGDRMRFEWREGTRVLGMPPFGSSTISGLGLHLITLTVRDSRGGVSTDVLEVTVVDPVAALQAQITALLASLATANDTIAGLEAALAAATSGLANANATIAALQFELAQCQANGSNPAQEAATQLAALVAQVTGVGPGKSLQSKLMSAQASLQAGDTGGACSTLHAFLNEVAAQAGKKLTAAQAAAFTAAAQSIRALIGC